MEHIFTCIYLCTHTYTRIKKEGFCIHTLSLASLVSLFMYNYKKSVTVNSRMITSVRDQSHKKKVHG